MLEDDLKKKYHEYHLLTVASSLFDNPLFIQKKKLSLILADPCYLMADPNMRMIEYNLRLGGCTRELQQFKTLYLIGLWRSEFNKGDFI